MRWFKPNLRSSLHAIFSLGHSAPPAPSLGIGIDDIREAMLGLLSTVGPERFPNVTRRIRYATDVQALWFLRGDLMAVLASSHGEAVAREELAEISEMFENMLPEGLRSRPSPLSSGSKE